MYFALEKMRKFCCIKRKSSTWQVLGQSNVQTDLWDGKRTRGFIIRSKHTSQSIHHSFEPNHTTEIRIKSIIFQIKRNIHDGDT